MSKDPAQHFLRRTLTPYVGQSLIVSGVVVFTLAVVVRTGQWEILVAPVVIVLLMAFPLYVGLKYRIYWTDSVVCMTASGGPPVKIKFTEITKVESELAGPANVIAQARPLRRIAIYTPDESDPDGERLRWVDVSLRHFNLDDIAELMDYIHQQRSDLEMPQIPEIDQRSHTLAGTETRSRKKRRAKKRKVADRRKQIIALVCSLACLLSIFYVGAHFGIFGHRLDVTQRPGTYLFFGVLLSGAFFALYSILPLKSAFKGTVLVAGFFVLAALLGHLRQII